ncbi:MAG TPA: isopeptide-forming domain-containing fimbrial protein [Pyrinomonadaceae bacterium]|nr:isopeptide-forming domain-containing fimbrial protein [Pyrinomonadaceae bacterium]
MRSKSIQNLILIMLLVPILMGQQVLAFDGATSGGTVISNRAEATYEDEQGTNYSAVSPTVTVTIQAVVSLTVTPDETTASNTIGQRERITRVFRICNTGNVADSYTITAASVDSPAALINLHFDNDASGTLTDTDPEITVNGTTSKQISPNTCLGVLAVVDTLDFPLGNLAIRITARSNTEGVNGRPSDEGTIINTVGSSARLTSPSDTNLPPLKTVNDNTKSIVSIGTPFTYSITFRNSGDATARSVVVTDNLQPKLEYVSGSLTLDGRNLTDGADADEGEVQGRRLMVQLPAVAAGQIVNISFRARLMAGLPAGAGVINTAELTGQNIAPTNSTTAIVVVDPFGTVFSGRGGGSLPISGARVSLLVNQTEDSALPIPPGLGFAPNLQNDNPFATDGLGRFSFALLPEQLGTQTTPVRYFIKVNAQGYSTRMLEITARATHDELFVLNVHAIDGQPLARAGGFDLVREDVFIEDITSVALNIPMFEPNGLEISKSADRPRAEIGDAVAYRIEIRNPTATPVRDVLVRDRLPVSFHYATGTGRLSVGTTLDQPIEPEIAADGEIVFRVGEIGAGATARVTYRVRVGANAREGEQENVAVASGLFPNGETIQSAAGRASIVVGRGAFSTRQIIVGRVFIDQNGNGKFDDGDEPVPSARLFLQSGQSVITDSQGLYNVPSLADGSHVISLDPITIPSGYALADGGTLAGRSWTRLLRTPLGGGALLRQNFALSPTDATKLSAFAAATSKASETAKNPTAPKEAAPVKVSLKEQPGVSRFETTTTEILKPVAPGNIQVLSPEENSVVMTPAMQFDARVALNWKVKLEVNGKLVSDKSIGIIREDQKNNVTTYTFVGLELRPGQNAVRATAIGPNGAAGDTVELTVMGRGQATRLEVVPDKSQVQAGGRDSITLHVRAFDQWGNPAADDQVAIETSAGELRRIDEESAPVKGQALPAGAAAAEESDVNGQRQVMISLERGEATAKLIGNDAPGEARLRALMGQIESTSKVLITPESRPTILVGLAEMTFGQSLPEVNLRDEQGKYRNHLGLFYSGRIGERNLLTLSYDSQRPINRTAGRDRLFQLDPLDRVYPLFGDSSTRYEAAQSNSKFYARLDRDRSYAMFGDFEADLEDLELTGYARKLTGVKVHLENKHGDFISLTGARPDTSFARDVFPAGSLSLIRLSNSEILPGSETVVLEVRDRRNPETIISRETLSRSVDYNINSVTGELFFLRYLSAFDYDLNLMQLVVTYEHRASSLSSAVYTGRARKNFTTLGLQLGFATVLQRQEDAGSFVLAGIDAEKTLPNKGKVRFAFARSQGEIMGGGNVFSSGDSRHDGNAFLLELDQPLRFYHGLVKARYSYSSEGFLNPFGTTITPGSRRGEISIELKPRSKSLLKFGATDERNHTANVDNNRLTFSALWEQIINERIRFRLGYDHRSFDDATSTRDVESNLVTAGVDLKLTDKLQLAVKREQNLGDADPTYPNQTTLAATYQVNKWAKFFLTQRLASAPITPIADFTTSGSGFSSTGARRETALGIETRLGKYSALVSRYQLENGINGTDSFAVIGLQNRLPLTKQLSLEFGFERGFHVAGNGESYNSATLGFGWQPTENFRANARYEFRDRTGAGQVLAFGAAGTISEGLTALSRFQWSRTNFDGRHGSAMEGTGALAYRPLSSDRVGVLFSFTHRSLDQDGFNGTGATRDRLDSLATDGYFQATNRLELYGRLAVRFSANGQADLPFVSTFTYLTQGRAQYRLTRRIDWAAEMRRLTQPSSGTHRSIYGTEIGVWALPDLRVGLGYNFSVTGEPFGANTLPARRGFYFTLSSKLSNLFDLFGTSKSGLDNAIDNNVAKNKPGAGDQK